MIYHDGSKIGELFIRGCPIIEVYLKLERRAIEKIWPEESSPIIDEIMSCFYNGYWMDEYPWTDDTPWID